MEESDTVQEFISRVNETIEELEGVGVTIGDEEQAMKLLASLPERFETLTITLENRSEDLTADFVKTRLLQEETRQNDVHKNDNNALLSRNKQKGTKGKNQENEPGRRPKCFHCGKPGHKRDNCWVLHPEKRNASKDEKEETESASICTAAAFHARHQNETTNIPMCLGINGSASEIIANVVSVETKACTHWYVDSGATQHMTSNKGAFKTYRETSPNPVSMADGKTIKAIGVGTVSIKLKTGNTTREGILHEVLHVPELHGSLFSVTKATALGNSVEFGRKGCTIRNRTGKIVATAARKGKLYELLTVNNEWRNPKADRSRKPNRDREQKRRTNASPKNEARNRTSRNNNNEHTRRMTKEVVWVNLTPPRKNVNPKRTSNNGCTGDDPKNEQNGNDDDGDKKDSKSENAAHYKDDQEKRTSTRKKNLPERYVPT